MLNKADLSKFGKVVKHELTNYVTKTSLEQALQNHPTKADLARELKPLKQDIGKIRKDINVIISLFDREYIGLRKRVDRIEQHFGIGTP